jgi:TonB-linked SusC/RagA family outer membrane protein
MKKSKWLNAGCFNYCHSGKIFLKMKLTIMFIMAGIIQVVAINSYSQTTRLTFELKSASVADVLKEIENQSEFYFAYDKDAINLDRKLDLTAKNLLVEEILDQLFRETNVKYKITDRHIILSTLELVEPQKSVSGKVTDNSGSTLPGVSVVVKGTTNGVITDNNGKYSLSNLPENATLLFSFVGMKTQEIKVGTQTSINVMLADEAIGIEEVVAIGYGTAKRRDFTGSVSSVNMKISPVAMFPNSNALESLKGSVAGLNIGATNISGGEPSVLIRGQRSISGTNSPLIVVDGIIFLGSISDINPNDIESFDILKDAVSASVYGSRSANGVILITTKKGTTTKPQISFKASGGVQTWQNKPGLYNGEGWVKLTSDKNNFPYASDSWWKYPDELANRKAGIETDWLSEATHIGKVQDYQIAISGAPSPNTNYYFSASYDNNEGIVKGDDFTHLSILSKINTSVTPWLKVGIDLGYSNRDYSGLAANLGAAFHMPPYAVNLRDGHIERWPHEDSIEHPLWASDSGTADNLDIRNQFRMNAYSVIDIPWIKGLSFRTNLTSTLNKNKGGSFYHENYYVKVGNGSARYEPANIIPFLSNANGNIITSDETTYVLDNILNYKKTFNKHNVDVTMVATRDSYVYDVVTSSGTDFKANGNTVLGMSGISFAAVQKITTSNTERKNIGYLSRVNYSFNDKYYLTASYRRDGASVFGAEKKWANFAASGVAWRISNEDFLKRFKPLKDLKIKLSWGQNGNQGIAPYGTLSTILNGTSSVYKYEFGNSPGTVNYGLYQNAIGNEELGWEKTSAWNTGFESSWLNSRISVDVDYYLSKTTDQIFSRNIPAMIGFQTMKSSMGEVANMGIELTVKSVNIKAKNLNWNTSLIFSKNNNKLEHLYGTDINGDGIEDDDLSNSLFIGKSIGTIFGYELDGIVQVTDIEYIALTGAKPGYPKYKDTDGKPGITTGDRTFLGSNKENFRLNMSNSITYKNFQLYGMIIGSFGGNGNFLQKNDAAFQSWNIGYYNSNALVKPYWTNENPSNTYPAAFFSGDSRYSPLQSRGFVRIQDVSISYTFNQGWIKTAGINSMRVFFTGRNLATFTKWIGGDPEMGTTIYSNSTFPSTYTIGANISF